MTSTYVNKPQAEIPKEGGMFSTGPVLRRRDGHEGGAAGWRVSERLCCMLNDLRDTRAKQGELASSVRGALPRDWLLSTGYQAQLGDRFKFCQVGI